jgi:hypothetical protein
VGGGEREGGVGRKKGFSFSELARRPAQLPSLEGGGHPQPRNYARNATGGRRNIGPFTGYVGCGAGERSEAGRLHTVEPPSASEVDLGGGGGGGGGPGPGPPPPPPRPPPAPPPPPPPPTVSSTCLRPKPKPKPTHAHS